MSEYLTPAELAKSLRVCKRTLTRWSESGRMPRPLKVAGTIRYPRAAIVAWADKQTGQKDG